MEVINAHPRNTDQLIGFVFSERHVVFRHTGDHARPASSTLIQIDEHSEFVGFFYFHLNLIAGVKW